jgi:ABC-type oligopeptide transport system ATPase subunit
LQRELGVSYLFITHNIGVVEYIADHVAVMNQAASKSRARRMKCSTHRAATTRAPCWRRCRASKAPSAAGSSDPKIGEESPCRPEVFWELPVIGASACLVYSPIRR